MKFLSREYQWSKIQSAWHSPETEIKCRPQAFQFDNSLTMFYRGLKHEHVTDFSRRDRLLSSWIINEFLKSSTKCLPLQRRLRLSCYCFVNTGFPRKTKFDGELIEANKALLTRGCNFICGRVLHIVLLRFF